MRDVTELTNHLCHLAWNDGARGPANISRHTASAILDNPQAHIDALVEAGVLERHQSSSLEWDHWYTVAKAHVHQWRPRTVFDGARWSVRWVCNHADEPCDEARIVPIEVPND